MSGPDFVRAFVANDVETTVENLRRVAEHPVFANEARMAGRLAAWLEELTGLRALEEALREELLATLRESDDSDQSLAQGGEAFHLREEKIPPKPVSRMG